MMYGATRYLFIAIWIFLGIQSFAQDPSAIAANKELLRKASNDKVRAELLWRIGFNFSQSQPDSGIYYAKKSYVLSKKINFPKGLGDSENIWAFSLSLAGEYDSANVHYKNALRHFKALNDPCNTTVVLGNWGWNYLNHHEDAKGLECFLEAEKLDRACDSRGWKSTTYYNIGAAYNRMNEYGKAIAYFDQAIELEEQKKDTIKLAVSNLGKANALRGLNKMKDAEMYYKKSMYFNELLGNEYALAYVYENLGQLLFDMGDRIGSVSYCSKALKIFRELDRPGDFIYESLLIGTMLYESNRLKEAETILLEVLPRTIVHNTPYERKEAYDRLSKIYKKLKRTDLAFDYLSKFVALKDSLNEEDQKKNVAELTTRFETEKKDQQLKAERANRDSESERAERQTFQKYVFLTGAIVFGLITLVLINRFKIKKRAAKELEEKNILIEKEKDRAERSEYLKQQFLANMSHEIRTPMNAINGLSRLLLDKQHDDQTREYLEAISHSGDNMQVILNDILDLAKLESSQFLLHPIAFDLRKEANQIILIFNTKALSKGLFLKIEIDDKLPQSIKADAARLSQIWSNLISNAIKFTSKGGVLFKISASKQPDSMLVEVIDTGVGIDQQALTKIFDNFVQINHTTAPNLEGTGLGLTISKNLVERMGGQLAVTSNLGEGTTFSFTLIYSLAAEQDLVQKELKPLALSNTKHIIIAEDNDYNFLVTRDVLLKYFPSIQIYRAYNGREVIDLIEEDEYDLIFMDVKMPLMGGYEATKNIRMKGIQIPIVALSASVTQQEVDLCYSSGMNKFVMKPFADKDLIQVINHYFGINVIADNLQTEESINHFELFAKPLLLEFIEARKSHSLDDLKLTAHKARPLLIRTENTELAKLCEEIENQEMEEKLLMNKTDAIIQEFTFMLKDNQIL